MAKKAPQQKAKKESGILSIDRKELLASPQSYKSLFFGIATVIILFLIGFGITRLFFGGPTAEIDNEAVSTESIENALNNTGDYLVKPGDTLWSIAEEKYGSGFEWYRIADANKITDSTQLEEGTTLSIPQMEESSDTNETAVMEEGGDDMKVEMSPEASNVTSSENSEQPVISQTTDVISGDSYVIKPGDDLWDIAVRAYGDGYKWVDIATSNNLENPDLIHADNTLKLPR